jgi:hypothetical protein
LRYTWRTNNAEKWASHIKEAVDPAGLHSHIVRKNNNYGAFVVRAWSVLTSRMEGQSPDMEGRCEYTEQIGMILPLEGSKLCKLRKSYKSLGLGRIL